MPAKTKKAKSKKTTAAKKKTTKKLIKKAVKKKTARKKAVQKKKTGKTKARTARTPTAAITSKEAVIIEPGPPSVYVPPVEEPAANEQAIGTVTHYYSHLSVAVIQINKGLLQTGSTIHVKGHTTDFFQSIESMEYEHQHVEQAGAGQSVGLKVKDHVRQHDIIFLVR